jgi:hypothetical protein
MKTLKKLHAMLRKWVKGARRRRPTRSARLGLEALEQRELPSANPLALGGWTSLGGVAQSVSTARDANGNLDVFVIGSNNDVDYRSQSPSGAWSGWTPLGGWVTSISAIRDSSGNLDVFVIGSNNDVDYRSQSPSGAWSGWHSLGGGVLSISTALDARGNLDVFAIATDQSVWYRSQSPLGIWWNNWTDLGGRVSSISTIRDNSGDLEVFGIGGDQSVWYRSQNPNNYAWSGWIGLAGWVSAISTAVDMHGDLEVFGIGGDQSVWYQSLPPLGDWSGWTSIGGGGVTSISTSRDSDGTLGVFGIAGNSVWYQLQAPGGAWSGWMGLGGGVTSISAIEDTGGNLGVVAIAPGGAVWYREEAAYSPVNGTLFGPGGPSYLDVQQGGVGDCWLMASLAEVAARDPQDITSMFTYDGTTVVNDSVVDVYTVRFYNPLAGAQYVTVDTELPAGGGLYDNPTPVALGGSTTVLWPALAEKAYVEASAAGIVTSGHVGFNTYDALNNGDPVWALQAITGQPASDYAINPTDVAGAWNAGELVVLNTTSPTSSYIAGGHSYALVNYASSSGNFTIFNPWGTDANGWAPGNSGTIYGLFWANAPFVSQNFSSQAFGVGAAPSIASEDVGGAVLARVFEGGSALPNPAALDTFSAHALRQSAQPAGFRGESGGATATDAVDTAFAHAARGSRPDRLLDFVPPGQDEATDVFADALALT